jgi:hypothetical protein
MTRTHFLPTALVLGLAGTALAFVALAVGAGAAQAGLLCLPTQPCATGSPTPTAEPSPAPPPAKKPPAPGPKQPVAPAQPPVDPAPAVPTTEPAPTAQATGRTTASASPSTTSAPTTAAPTTASAAPSRSDSSPTGESNWNKPIESPTKASHAAAVSTEDQGPDAGTVSVFVITGGVLLVGFGVLVLALWTRNRLAGHW